MDRTARVSVAFAKVGIPALQTAGLLDERTKPDALEWLYRLYYGAGFIVVLFIPTYPTEALIYFPAILALSGAWLLAMPLYGAGLSSQAFADLQPPRGAWRTLIVAFQKQRIPVPMEATKEDIDSAVDRALPQLIPAAVPAAMLKMLRLLALRASFVGVVGILGILAGPSLAQIHLWHEWSPVAILLALSAPLAVLLLMSLLVPFFVQSFMVGLQMNAAMNRLASARESHSEAASKTTRSRRSRLANDHVNKDSTPTRPRTRLHP